MKKMSSPLHEVFDRIVCISLLEREDKKIIVEKKLNDHGITPEFYRPVIFGFNKMIIEDLYRGKNSRFTKEHPNEIGCSLSHYTVIKTAYLEGVERLFIFEDDILFNKDFDVLLSNSLKSLPYDWQMIMLYGYTFNDEFCKRVNSRWTEAHNLWSAMAYGMNRNAMKTYIEMMDKFFSVADYPTITMQDILKVYCSVPTLCIPNTKLGSDIRSDMNYENHKTKLNYMYGDENYI